MHGLSRLGTGRSTASPPSSPRFRHGRNKGLVGGGGGGFGGRGSKHNSWEKLVVVLITAVFKRKGVLLLAPLLYISVMLLYMGSLGFDVVDLKGVVVHKRAPPGTVYRSPQVFKKVWPFMEAEAKANATDNALMTAWNSKARQGWKPCANRSYPKAVILQKVFGVNSQNLSASGSTSIKF